MCCHNGNQPPASFGDFAHTDRADVLNPRTCPDADPTLQSDISLQFPTWTTRYDARSQDRQKPISTYPVAAVCPFTQHLKVIRADATHQGIPRPPADHDDHAGHHLPPRYGWFNENTNGLLRQYFPKGTDLSRWTAKDLAAVAHTLDTRPRKVLEWRSPTEAIERHLQSLQQQSVATTS